MKQESTNSKTDLAIVEYRKSGLSDFKKLLKLFQIIMSKINEN